MQPKAVALAYPLKRCLPHAADDGDLLYAWSYGAPARQSKDSKKQLPIRLIQLAEHHYHAEHYLCVSAAGPDRGGTSSGDIVRATRLLSCFFPTSDVALQVASPTVQVATACHHKRKAHAPLPQDAWRSDASPLTRRWYQMNPLPLRTPRYDFLVTGRRIGSVTPEEYMGLPSLNGTRRSHSASVHCICFSVLAGPPSRV